MIERIGHINIKTPLFAETCAFYEALFDLRRVPALTMADQERNAWLATAEGQPVIHVNTGETPAPSGPARLDHVAFECRDVAAMRARLDALGVPHVHAVSRVPTLEQVFFTDLNGIRIELTFDTANIPQSRSS
ncbi:VOC family protein [Sphingomonas sp. BIUV-7]|uniref:VOC family protein n=1 Tax=Sphingomonas natans TaxID=3063330 RepID=A0ABT8Y4V4_9SPHN|nr:VOC family protein [Sphingomonas sp. BIUV-7]MDO6413357.1 VOC family protein [Sphingomonas sp. BIUV-7]